MGASQALPFFGVPRSPPMPACSAPSPTQPELLRASPGPGTPHGGMAWGWGGRASSPAEGGSHPVFVSDTGCWASDWLRASALGPAGASGSSPGVQAPRASCLLSHCRGASPGTSRVASEGGGWSYVSPCHPQGLGVHLGWPQSCVVAAPDLCQSPQGLDFPTQWRRVLGKEGSEQKSAQGLCDEAARHGPVVITGVCTCDKNT